MGEVVKLPIKAKKSGFEDMVKAIKKKIKPSPNEGRVTIVDLSDGWAVVLNVNEKRFIIGSLFGDYEDAVRNRELLIESLDAEFGGKK